MSDLLNKEYMKAAAKFKSASKDAVEAYKKYKEALSKGPFDKKTNELLLLSAACAIQCSYCIESHGKKAKALGSSDEEIAHVIHLAAQIKHGATLSYGILGMQE
jgi:AhpD family alkylhydroperoxidase